MVCSSPSISAHEGMNLQKTTKHHLVGRHAAQSLQTDHQSEQSKIFKVFQSITFSQRGTVQPLKSVVLTKRQQHLRTSRLLGSLTGRALTRAQAIGYPKNVTSLSHLKVRSLQGYNFNRLKNMTGSKHNNRYTSSLNSIISSVITPNIHTNVVISALLQLNLRIHLTVYKYIS